MDPSFDDLTPGSELAHELELGTLGDELELGGTLGDELGLGGTLGDELQMDGTLDAELLHASSSPPSSPLSPSSLELPSMGSTVDLLDSTQSFLERLAASDTSALESLASSVLLQIYEQTQLRESQTRQLADLDRQLSHTDAGVLAALEPLEQVPKEQVNVAIEMDCDLVASLAAMHEYSQVTRHAMSDAQRRLRSLRTGLEGWRDEFDAAQSSQRWIEQSQEVQAAKEARTQLEQVRSLLDDAEVHAKRLLSV